MVRLGVNQKSLVSSCVVLFQFHYGAIGRILRSGVGKSTALISIPLWCDWEAEGLADAIDDYVNFNSTMVRLGDFYSGKLIFLNRDFNSTMVRLGASSVNLSRQDFSSFQFHYGAIGRKNILKMN